MGNILIIIGCAVVAIILLRGLFNMMKGGTSSKSQQLMRLRVAAQAVTILIIVVVVYLSR
ncbi:MAG: twin transmembrane helix small protein [Pseudomonadota bacterium]